MLCSPTTFYASRASARALAFGLAVVLVAGCLGDSTQDGASAAKPGAACSPEKATAPAADGCNTCICDSGHWVCTEIACAPDAGATCKDGDTKLSDDGCNTCSCSGGQWLCTQRACVLDAGTGCRDGDTKLADDGCNTCTCSGGQWACTLLGCVTCPPPATSGDVCAAVVVYAKDPITGMCCEYGSPCTAPAGWAQYNSVAECDGSATELQWFTTCGAPVCGPISDQPTGQPLCAAGETEGAVCVSDGALCDPSIGCGTNLVCANSDPKLSPGGCPISRARYKRDIEYVSVEERAILAEQVLSLPLATYRYRGADETPHLGFIIEDVEPSMSVDAARDRVDLYGYTSMAVAALQQQQEELRALRAEIAALRAAMTRDDAVCR